MFLGTVRIRCLEYFRKGQWNVFYAISLQMWNDHRLVWNVSEFEGLDTIYISVTKMWTPDVMLYNK